MKIKWFLSAAILAAFLLHASSSFALETLGKQVILLDITTGTVLFEKNADELMTPSSMSKIMTVYKLFERLKKGGLSLTDTFSVSEKAWRKKGSKMFVRVNSRVKVEDLIRGIIVQSGNDATIVVAEGLSGSEGAFADDLNETAKSLGMKNSNFVNASGWPDPGHETTARDLSKLAIATIKNFPDFYHYYGEKTFTYNGIKQGNRNPTIYRNIGADGLKTGHTEAGGYGLTTSAIRKDRRLVLVINGLPSKKARSVESERLLDWGFREFNNYALFKAGESVTNAQVWMGDKGVVPLLIQKELTLTLPRKARRGMKVKVAMKEPVSAPINKGDVLATLKIEIPDRKILEIPLVAGANVGQLGMFSRLGAAVKFVLWGESD
ncbi:MAG: D-alanyl-D-alanine carboxypeptidase [Rhodospirillaceae bacterium]|jgi:serine-type D-Ala-D-Ala carboxypeptidase (penicillin-binding protein 5/6)|nr:D-alanyl-D-alanine carboxypeptidase [Rhodospirillaceae bacterium]MBT7267034.1 D-alanyl-D-alanine carboxypeptidase [Rhodospirillaceae bacterium]